MLVLFLIIVATAVLLQNFGSSDLVGMAASVTSVDELTEKYNTIKVGDDTYYDTYYVYLNEDISFEGKPYSAKTILRITRPGYNVPKITSAYMQDVPESSFVNEVIKEAEGFIYDDDIRFLSSTKSSVRMDPNDDPTAIDEAAKEYFGDAFGTLTSEQEPLPTTRQRAGQQQPTTQEPPKADFTINTAKGTLTVGEADYELILANDNKVYAKTTNPQDNTIIYIDLETGDKYNENKEKTGTSSLLTQEILKKITKNNNYKEWQKGATQVDTNTLFTGLAEKQRLEQEIAQQYTQLTKLGISENDIYILKQYYSPAQIKAMYEDIPEEYRTRVSAQNFIDEGKNINKYLTEEYGKEKEQQKIMYDETSGHFVGQIGDYKIAYMGDDIGVLEGNDWVYKHTEKGKTTYYTCNEDKNCLSEEGQEKYKETPGLRKEFRGAEKAVDRLATEVGDEVDTTIREAVYRQHVYDQQEAQTKGLISGWLNKMLDNQFGGWSRGVPAGICAHILGLEYYKEEGWSRTPMNSSAEQLQSHLIANSRTVIIEGEKEEITENLFRYAYTLKLLANQSMEWTTYLYNSCSQEASTDVFYDYGALGAGEYYSFHYAGAGEQDMIFDCTQELCLFDQACVVFTDGTLPVCVSLVHGAGFETPTAGSDYGCI